MTTTLLSKEQRGKLFSRYKQDTVRFLEFLDRSSENNKKPTCYLHFPDKGNYFVKLLSWKGEYNPPVEAELKSGLDKFIRSAIDKKKQDVILTFVDDVFVSCTVRNLKKQGRKSRGFIN